MEIGKIEKCRICGSSDLIPIINLGMQALSGRFPKVEEIDPPEAPLELVKCNDSNDSGLDVSGGACGLLQLRHTVSTDDLYLHDYGYRSGLNATMTNHLRNIVKDIENKIELTPGDLILDIGSNDATLLKAYSKPGLKKIGIDPTGKQFEKYYPQDVALVSTFFSADSLERVFPGKKAKVITSIAMIYDLPNPMNFVKDIKTVLHEEGVWVFEQSYMPLMIETNSFDTICHEHLEYYALKQIKWMIERGGLKILDVDFNDTNGGSFRVAVCHADAPYRGNEEKINKILEKEKSLELHSLKPYEEFKNRVASSKNEFVNFLKQEKEKGKSIYIYGASTKGNVLLQYFGVGAETITAAAERNPEKFGRRTPKTRIPIISEGEARESNPDYFVVLPWHFKKEFLEREKDYLESGGKFIFPLPKFEVIGSENLRPLEVERPYLDKREVSSENVLGKKALITGITGQIGSYLAELLLEKGYEVHGIIRRLSSSSSYGPDSIDKIKHIGGKINLVYGDLSDYGSIERAIQEIQPDEIYNLGAQSNARISFDLPEYTLKVNELVVMRICEAVRNLKKKVKIYQAGSAEFYGNLNLPNGQVDENTEFSPENPYALAKLSAFHIIKYYRKNYGMFCCNGIMFNSESPRRGENFVTRKITLGISNIMEGKEEKLRLGNLNAQRDWIHAKDTASAIWKILQSETPDDYIVSLGESHSIREFVELAFKEVGIEILWQGEGINEKGFDKNTGKELIVVDPIYFRKSDRSIIGNSSKARNHLAWTPMYSFESLVKEMMKSDLEKF